MCCGYALNGMHLAQPTVMHCSTLLHHVECTWGALGARVRPTPILNPATAVVLPVCVGGTCNARVSRRCSTQPARHIIYLHMKFMP